MRMHESARRDSDCTAIMAMLMRSPVVADCLRDGGSFVDAFHELEVLCWQSASSNDRILFLQLQEIKEQLRTLVQLLEQEQADVEEFAM